MNRATANNDHTVVSLACAGGHLAVVELLLAHGADPTHRLKVRHTVWMSSILGLSNSNYPQVFNKNESNHVMFSLYRMVQPC